MKGNRFYSVPYDARNDPKMRIVRRKCGGIAAFGRWQALLGILYDMDGMIDLSDETVHGMIEDELELKGESLDDFISVLTSVGWIDLALWESQRHVLCRGVCDQLSFRTAKADAGRKGGRPSKGDAEKQELKQAGKQGG